MQRSWLVVLILLLAGISIYVDMGRPVNIGWLGYSNSDQLHQGLDLQGGIQFLFSVRCPDTNPKCDIGGQIGNVVTIINQRVSGGLGVSEAVVTSQQDATTGQYYISVELPGVKDDKQALQVIGTTGLLQIIDTGGLSLQTGTTVTTGQYPVRFTGAQLDPNAIQVSFDTTNKPQVAFKFQGAAQQQFADYTQQNLGKYLTITLDNKVIESAIIQSQITSTGVISGNLTLDSANNLASVLKYGSLPLPMSLSTERQIDATLGAQAIKYSITAAEIGLGLVIFFMLIYYRLPGFVATIALALYAIFMFAAIRLLGVVLTLAGIAGVILSIGMAVDANILIFERIKEELRSGRTLAAAIDQGWKRAWTSIRDSNASTLITCAILWVFGNNFGATIIVGFATNLMIGVLISLFTAVVVTRNFLHIVMRIPGVATNAWLFGVPKDAMVIPSYRRPARPTTTAPAALAMANGSRPSEEEEE